MADELRGIEIRLERAYEHIHALNHEARMYMMELPPPYSYVIDKKSEDGSHVVRAKVSRLPPVRHGVLAADGAHNLRAALDMLAWELARKGPTPPTDSDTQTAFPICSGENAWKSNRTQRMIELLPLESIPIIRSLQPYKRPDMIGLLRVQAIDNWAKHHAIPGLIGFHISRLRLLSSDVEIVSHHFGEAFEDGDEIARVRWNDANRDTEKHLRMWMQCHVGFAKNGPGHGFPIDFLENTHNLIRDQIVPAFQPFFD